MNIAVCISGGIRYPHIGIKSLEKIIPNSNVKIFIHTWKIKDRNEFLKTVAELQYKEENNTVTNDFNLIHGYNYESLLIETYDTKKEAFENKFKCLKFSEYHRHDVGPISMHYSIFKSNQLKLEYERKHRMVFDVVVRMRFDSDFEDRELNLHDFGHGLYIPEGEDWCGGINDQFALGTSHMMDVYSDFYNHMDQVQDVPYHPETMLRRYLEIKGIYANRFDFPVKINNKIDFRKAMFGE